MLGICDNCQHTAELHASYDNPVCSVCDCYWYVNSGERLSNNIDSIRINSKYFSSEPVVEPTVMMVGRWFGENRKRG